MNNNRQTTVLGNISASTFLEKYWQKQPLLIKNAIPGFTSPISPDELAGLACQDDVESRIVLEKHGAVPWELRHGPFAEKVFAELPETHWTLLIQECNKYVPELASLLDEFSFIPNWRIDDIMVSYAAPQGSVGPHVDQYDVFLLQGLGQRLWQINTDKSPNQNFLPDTDLRILQNFSAEQEWLLQPGDMLYLPPGVAHYGVAQDDCVTLSVGFRAPSHYDLLTAFAEDQYAHISDPFDIPRYQDPDLAVCENSGEINPQALGNIINILRSYISNEQAIKRWFGRFITEPKHESNAHQPEITYSKATLQNSLEQQPIVYRSEYARFAYIQAANDITFLYINGIEYLLPEEQQQLAPLICNQRKIASEQLLALIADENVKDILLSLFNEDYLSFPNLEKSYQ